MIIRAKFDELNQLDFYCPSGPSLVWYVSLLQARGPIKMKSKSSSSSSGGTDCDCIRGDHQDWGQQHYPVESYSSTSRSSISIGVLRWGITIALIVVTDADEIVVPHKLLLIRTGTGTTFRTNWIGIWFGCIQVLKSGTGKLSIFLAPPHAGCKPFRWKIQTENPASSFSHLWPRSNTS